MSEILNDFNKANEYFVHNYERIKSKYSGLIKEFEKIYNKTTLNPGPKINPRQGTAIAIAFRAIKFLYTAFDLVQHGHTQEARIILRNVQELRIVYLDIALNQQAYELWRLTQDLKKKTIIDNIIDSEKLKQKIIQNKGSETIGRLTVNSSIKRLRRVQDSYINQILTEIIQERDGLSEFISHENIFNLVRRMDVINIGNNQEQVDIYIGSDADSNLINYFLKVLNLLKEIEKDTSFILGK